MFKSRCFSFPFGSLAALEIGQPSDAEMSVVFLHGWLDNAASFQSVMQAMWIKNPHLHLIAVDLAGHGHSSHKSSDHFYPFHDYIDDLHQILRDLSPEPCLLVGHSLGALIAACYSAAFPEQIAGLVQIEAHQPLYEEPSHAAQRLRDGIISRQRSRAKPQRCLPSLADAIALRAKRNQLAEALIAPVVERGTQCRDGRWYWRHDRKLQCDSLYRMSEAHAQSLMSAITCPIEVIVAHQGYEHLHVGYQPASNMTMVTVAGGHHCHLQYPELIAERILGMVNKNKTSA